MPACGRHGDSNVWFTKGLIPFDNDYFKHDLYTRNKEIQYGASLHAERKTGAKQQRQPDLGCRWD
jgi:hypothetical protein